MSQLPWKPYRVISISHVVQIQDMCGCQITCKSEGMSSTLFTMELTSNSFTKMSDFEVYRLPWLPYMRHTFEFGIC